MASKALIVKANKKPKFSSRKVFRCLECGRSKGTFRINGGIICRIHLREYFNKGLIPGYRKSS